MPKRTKEVLPNDENKQKKRKEVPDNNENKQKKQSALRQLIGLSLTVANLNNFIRLNAEAKSDIE